MEPNKRISSVLEKLQESGVSANSNPITNLLREQDSSAVKVMAESYSSTKDVTTDEDVAEKTERTKRRAKGQGVNEMDDMDTKSMDNMDGGMKPKKSGGKKKKGMKYEAEEADESQEDLEEEEEGEEEEELSEEELAEVKAFGTSKEARMRKKRKNKRKDPKKSRAAKKAAKKPGVKAARRKAAKKMWKKPGFKKAAAVFQSKLKSSFDIEGEPLSEADLKVNRAVILGYMEGAVQEIEDLNERYVALTTTILPMVMVLESVAAGRDLSEADEDFLEDFQEHAEDMELEMISESDDDEDDDGLEFED